MKGISLFKHQPEGRSEWETSQKSLSEVSQIDFKLLLSILRVLTKCSVILQCCVNYICYAVSYDINVGGSGYGQL